MYRNKLGQVAHKTWKATKIIFWLTCIAATAIYALWATNFVDQDLSVAKTIKAVNPVPVAHAGITAEAKIAATKDDLVESLAKDCETKDVKEPDAAIIFDSNNEPSIGAWQYQRKTIQHFYKTLYGKDISRTEAIEIAIDHERAAELTKAILFGVEGGWKNWLNCAQKLDLPVQISLLKKLDN